MPLPTTVKLVRHCGYHTAKLESADIGRLLNNSGNRFQWHVVRSYALKSPPRARVTAKQAHSHSLCPGPLPQRCATVRTVTSSRVLTRCSQRVKNKIKPAAADCVNTVQAASGCRTNAPPAFRVMIRDSLRSAGKQDPTPRAKTAQAPAPSARSCSPAPGLHNLG